MLVTAVTRKQPSRRRDVASNISAEIARQIYYTHSKAEHYLPSTSLAIVASCMFDVPS